MNYARQTWEDVVYFESHVVGVLGICYMTFGENLIFGLVLILCSYWLMQSSLPSLERRSEMAEKKKWTQERVTLRIGTGLVLLAAAGLLSMVFPLLYIAVGAVVAFFVGCPVIEKLTLPGLPNWSWGNGASKVDGNKVLDAAKAHSSTPKEKQDAPAMSLIGEKIACPKCTSKPSSVKLCNGKEQKELLFDTKTFTFSDDGCNYKDEHLHVTCGLCGHRWVCQTNL